MSTGPEHHQFISKWLDDTARGLDSGQLASLLNLAVAALWRRANATISEITLAVVFTRIVANSAEKYPFLTSTRVDETGVDLGELVKTASSLDRATLRGCMQFVLTETLNIFGSLTEEVLTPGLRRTLCSVMLGRK